MGKYSPFREGPLCEVRGNVRDLESGPETVIIDDTLLIHLKLVKAGYGSFKDVIELNARVVLQALYYDKFLSDYESASLKDIS